MYRAGLGATTKISWIGVVMETRDSSGMKVMRSTFPALTYLNNTLI